MEETVTRAFKLDGIFSYDSTIEVFSTVEGRPDTYAILDIQYRHSWRALVINGNPIPITQKMSGTHTVQSIQAKLGNTRTWTTLPWFNLADAAILDSHKHPENHATITLLLLQRKGTKDIFDIVPSTKWGFSLFDSPMISVRISSHLVDPVPEFAFPDNDATRSVSPSTTVAWRRDFLSPLLQWLILIWSTISSLAFVFFVYSTVTKQSSASSSNTVSSPRGPIRNRLGRMIQPLSSTVGADREYQWTPLTPIVESPRISTSMEDEMQRREVARKEDASKPVVDQD